jgi:hypothetical protein
MNYIQRIYDLLVEAQINEVGVYRSTVTGSDVNPYLQANPNTGKSEYAIRNTKGKLMNIKDPRVMASAEKGSEIRRQKGLPQLPSLRDRARNLMTRSHQAGKTTHSRFASGDLHDRKSRGHGMKSPIQGK